MNPETSPNHGSVDPSVHTISLQGLHKVYGEGEARLHVLKGLDLNVRRGEFLAITGPSGSGKSTLLNILGCLDKPTDGHYFLDGVDISRMTDNELSTIRNQKLGFIFQSFNLVPQLSVLENVAVPQMYSEEELQPDRCQELLDKVGLSHRLGHKPAQLSGGERQRVAIARSLVNDPVVLLADEPTGNLDTKTGEEVLKIIESLHESGRTVVMITHDPEVADRAEREIHIRDGLIEVRK